MIQYQRIYRRRGLSLIEVIACTAIVAVMIVPIASVIRSSSRTIQRVETDATAPQHLRSTSTWLRDTLRTSQIYAVATNSVKLQLPSGDDAAIYRKGKVLVLENGSGVTVLCSDVIDVAFRELLTATKPARRIGIIVSLTAIDSARGVKTSLQTTVALAP